MRAPSLGGRLEDIALPELLQFLSTNHKTGRLSLSRRDGEGLVLLREGQIVYAASSSVRETFGNILVCRGLISEATLVEALERQHGPGEQRRLGAILVEMGRVQPDDLREAVRQQIGVVLLELARWPSGFFKFEALSTPGPSEIEVDAQELLVTEGVNTDRVLMELVTRLDEESGGEELPPREIASPLRAPSLRGEITAPLIRYAAQVLERGVLFVVRGDHLDGLSHFGLGDAEGVRGLSIPLGEPSLFADVMQGKATFRGPSPSTGVHERLRARLGGAAREVVLIPVVLAGSVAMLLYGENPRRSTAGLEELFTEAGLGMERDALEERIGDFERSRRRP